MRTSITSCDVDNCKCPVLGIQLKIKALFPPGDHKVGGLRSPNLIIYDVDWI
jgi:hypothetical protein